MLICKDLVVEREWFKYNENGFNHIKFIMNEYSQVLVQDKKIKERLRSYFEKLLNKNHTGKIIL